MAQPSPDHFLPVLYVAAAADESDEVSFPIEGFDWGSLSMRSVAFSAPQTNRTL
jgi:4,5-DOPA dioxygenase extradiol